MTRARSLSCVAIAAVLMALPGAAQAQDRASVDRARELGNEGGDLIDRKEYAAALEKLEQAEALYHAPTHLALMGEALEQLGRLAEALAVYERVAAEPLPAKAPPAFKKAQQDGQTRMRALLSRVPSLLVEVQGAAQDEVTATLDGKPFELGSGVAKRVDPGERTLRVEAPGRQPFEKKLDLAERGGVVKVEVVLKPASAESPAAVELQADEPPAPAAGSSGPPPLAFVCFGLAAVGIGVGAVTGIMSLGKVSDLEDSCPGGDCPASEQDTIDSAGTLGTVSTIGFIVGGAAAAAGVIVMVAAPGSAAPASGGNGRAAVSSASFGWDRGPAVSLRGRF